MGFSWRGMGRLSMPMGPVGRVNANVKSNEMRKTEEERGGQRRRLGQQGGSGGGAGV